MEGPEPPTPELLDAVVDSEHRSYYGAVHHAELSVLRTRTPRELLDLDERWVHR